MMAIVFIDRQDKYTGYVYQLQHLSLSCFERNDRRDNSIVSLFSVLSVRRLQIHYGKCNEDSPYLIRNNVQEIIKGVNISQDKLWLIPLLDVVSTACVVPNNLDQPWPITKWLYVRRKMSGLTYSVMQWNNVSTQNNDT
jgi:hypothetical protein